MEQTDGLSCFCKQIYSPSQINNNNKVYLTLIGYIVFAKYNRIVFAKNNRIKKHYEIVVFTNAICDILKDKLTKDYASLYIYIYE